MLKSRSACRTLVLPRSWEKWGVMKCLLIAPVYPLSSPNSRHSLNHINNHSPNAPIRELSGVSHSVFHIVVFPRELLLGAAKVLFAMTHLHVMQRKGFEMDSAWHDRGC